MCWLSSFLLLVQNASYHWISKLYFMWPVIHMKETQTQKHAHRHRPIDTHILHPSFPVTLTTSPPPPPPPPPPPQPHVHLHVWDNDGSAGEVGNDKLTIDNCSFAPKQSTDQHYNIASAQRKHHLVGLVLKVSASRAQDPGFDSRLRSWDLFGSSHKWLTDWLPGAWRQRVSAGIGWPVSYTVSEWGSLISDFYFSVAAHNVVWALDPSLRYTSMLLER